MQLITKQITDLKQSRHLASEITSRGASVYDLLGLEADLRVNQMRIQQSYMLKERYKCISVQQDQRTTALARPLELDDLEDRVSKSVKSVEVRTIIYRRWFEY